MRRICPCLFYLRSAAQDTQLRFSREEFDLAVLTFPKSISICHIRLESVKRPTVMLSRTLMDRDTVWHRFEPSTVMTSAVIENRYLIVSYHVVFLSYGIVSTFTRKRDAFDSIALIFTIRRRDLDILSALGYSDVYLTARRRRMGVSL